MDSIGSQLSFEVHIAIVTQISKFFKFLVYKVSFLIVMILGIIAVKIYNVGDDISVLNETQTLVARQLYKLGLP